MQALHGQQDPGLGLEPQLEPLPRARMENQDVSGSCCFRRDEWIIFGELKAKSCVKGGAGWELLELFKTNAGVTQTAFPGFSWDPSGSVNQES